MSKEPEIKSSVCVWGMITAAASCLIHFMEHEFPGDAGFRAVEFAGSALESCHHLLHDLVKEHGGELRVQDRAELERDLKERKIHRLFLGSFHGNRIGCTEGG